MRHPPLVVGPSTPPLKPAPPASSPATRTVMQANRAVDTAPELALRRALHGRGLRYRKHVSPLDGLRCKVDVVFARAKVAVFLDGCFWHRCPEHGSLPKSNREWWDAKLSRTWERDRGNDEALRAAGWTVVRVWEHEDPEQAALRISEIVRGGRPAVPGGGAPTAP